MKLKNKISWLKVYFLWGKNGRCKRSCFGRNKETYCVQIGEKNKLAVYYYHMFLLIKCYRWPEDCAFNLHLTHIWPYIWPNILYWNFFKTVWKKMELEFIQSSLCSKYAFQLEKWSLSSSRMSIVFHISIN